MSGRIRTIKPELLEDAVTAGLSDMAFRVFIGVIVLADDYGRFRAEPGWLMGQIYWNRTLQVETFLSCLGELAPLVNFYAVNGQRYGEIRNWAKHQKVSHPGRPRIPAPVTVSGDPPEGLRPDLRSPITDHDHEGDLPRARARVADATEPETSSGGENPDGDNNPTEGTTMRASGEKPCSVPERRVDAESCPEAANHPEPVMVTTSALADGAGKSAHQPEWVAPILAAVARDTGESLDAAVVWRAYRGSRASTKRALDADDFDAYLARWVARLRESRQERVSGTGPPPTKPEPRRPETVLLRDPRPDDEPDTPTPPVTRVRRVTPPNPEVLEIAQKLAAGAFG